MADLLAFLFKPKQKTPHELACQLKASSLILLAHTKPASVKIRNRALEDASKALNQLKNIFIDQEPDLEVIAELSQEAYGQGLLEIICECLEHYDFEARKGAVIIFNGLLRRQLGSRWPTVEYVSRRPKILWLLLKGYENKDIALNCGMILRECIKHECLAQILFDSADGNNIYDLFTYIELPTFDVASDAFATFQELMTRHRMLVAGFITESYDRVIPEFNKLLSSENYVTRRQSLKLLGEILSDAACEEVKRKYIFDSENLKVIMILMKDSSLSISTEAFRIFRMFIDNPTKSKSVHDILVKNQEKLITFMQSFEIEKGDDDFDEDRQVCLTLISELGPPKSEANSHQATTELC